FLVVVSLPYLRALTADLSEACRLGRPGSVAVLCAGAGRKHPLRDFLLPCDARLPAAVGGTLTSLNGRTAGRLLGAVGDEDWSIERCKQQLESWLTDLPRYIPKSGDRLTDTEVCDYIRGAFADEPSLRPGRLLRRLREAGLACEEKRFR